MLSFQTMEYFQAVARERSFTRAAASLHVTQQALSAHIAGIERELGVQLVVRATPLRLTHEGEVLLSWARRFEHGLVGLRRQLAGGAADQVGTLRVGVSHTRGFVIMPDIVARLSARYPGVLVEVREATNAQLRGELLTGDLDVAVGAFPEPLAGIELCDFYQEQVVLLASEETLSSAGLEADDIAGPLARGDLSPLRRCPLVLSPPDVIAGALASRLIAKAGFEPVVRARSTNMETLLALAMRGVGACTIPRILLEATATPEVKSRLLTFDLGPEGRYAISFGLPQEERRWCVTEDFVQLALEKMGETGRE